MANKSGAGAWKSLPNPVTPTSSSGSFRDIMDSQKDERLPTPPSSAMNSVPYARQASGTSATAWNRSKPVQVPWSGSQQITPSRKVRISRIPRSEETHVSNPQQKLDSGEISTHGPHVKGTRPSSGKSGSTACSDSTSKTSVVNVRKAELRKFGYKDLQDWIAKDTSHVYIGRDMTCYVPGAVGSKWGNPFKSQKAGREECCRMYKEYILTDKKIQANGKTLFESLHELKGKTLGCWCHPEKCHGHMLAELITEHCK